MTKDALTIIVRNCIDRILLDWKSDVDLNYTNDDNLHNDIITDSLDEVDLTLKIEKALDISIDKQIGRCKSVNDIVDYLLLNYKDKIEKI